MRIRFGSKCFNLQLAASYLPALAAFFLLPLLGRNLVAAQAAQLGPETPATVEIAKTPDHIPPKDVVPEVLRQSLEVGILNTPLSDVVDTLRSQLKLTVLLDEVALQQRDVLPGDPISLNGPFETTYALLEQLGQYKIGWYLDGDVLHLTDMSDADAHLMTVAHNVGDLLDLEFSADDLELLIKNSVGGNWDGPNDGSLIRLGDVFFVRQNMAVQLRVQALLRALQQPSERSLLMQSAQNQQLRALLKKKISVSFAASPLDQALENISQQLDAKISLDLESLETKRLRPNHPISLVVQDRSASQTLRFLLAPLQLAAVIKNDQIIVTTQQQSDNQKMTAVFDVRDLCRDESETYSLLAAFEEQVKLSSIYFAKDGIVVLRDTEPNLNVALNMLNNYRIALKSSKPRTEDQPTDDDVLTVYYRMPTEMANTVAKSLPALIGTKRWQEGIDSVHEDNELPCGTILVLASIPELLVDELSDMPSSVVVPQSTLVITHRRGTHQHIVACLRKIYHGEDQWSLESFGGTAGGLGGGGGGFGGGMFSVPLRK